MTTELLRTHDLTKRYGDFTALNRVSITLRQGDIYGLIGRNGAGKSTLFKCVMGLAKVSAGSIELCGSSTQLGRARKQIGFMINPAFFAYLNPQQNLSYLSKVKGIHSKSEQERLLKLVQLNGVKKPFKAFSLGMKQRLGIAGALLGNPAIVVLDEPINGLDPQGIADIRAVIKQEQQERGTTFIISSHILSELDLVANRFGFIEQGRLLQEISHDELHACTKKQLVVETNDPPGALSLLKSECGVEDAHIKGKQILIASRFDEPHRIAKALIGAGFELYRLAPQETTLEEYFIRLIEQQAAPGAEEQHNG